MKCLWIVLFVYLSLLNSVLNQCNPRDLLIKYEGKKECMYLDSLGKKTIGIGFYLYQKGAREIISKIGADYDAIVNKGSTRIHSSCNCSSTPKGCLTETQINALFEITIKDAVDCANQIGNFCCNVQMF
jgi:GH24 family phage-related lysozyme (muramidase)